MRGYDLEGEAERDPGALAERVTQAVGVAHTLTGDARRRYRVDGRTPAVVALPGDVDGVRAVVAAAAALNATVIPWGRGSRQAVGYAPHRYDLALSLERLRATLRYDPADLTLSVQAGVSLAALGRTLAAAGQMLPFDPPLPARATLGGALATGFSGLRRGLYGAPRDLTLGLTVVDATGELVRTGGRVVKNVTGYDMTKLYLGAFGSLGVIVEAHLKLMPIPAAEASLLGIFADPADAFTAVEPLAALGAPPAAIAITQVGALPELAPLAPNHLEYALLAVRFPGVAATVARALREGEAQMRAAGARATLPLDREAQDAFWAALDDFPQTLTNAPDEALIRMTTLPSECASALATATALASAHGLAAAWLADAATGTLWLRLRPSAPTNDADYMALAACLDMLQAAPALAGRPIVTLVCPSALKPRLALWAPAPPTMTLMRDLKRRLDPDERLNPGRYLVDAPNSGAPAAVGGASQGAL